MNRRSFLKTAAGLLVAAPALVVPERRVWALDKTMIPAGVIGHRIRYIPEWIEALAPLAPPGMERWDYPIGYDWETYRAIAAYLSDSSLPPIEQLPPTGTTIRVSAAVYAHVLAHTESASDAHLHIAATPSLWST